MQITLYWPRFYSWKRKRIIQKAVEFVVTYYNINTDIDININRSFTSSDIYGYITPWMTPWMQRDKVDYFNIHVELYCSFSDLLLIIFHEFVHADQYTSGDLQYNTTNIRYIQVYKNQIYNLKQLSYWDFPWEIEAYGTQRKLYENFLESDLLTEKERKYIMKRPESEAMKKCVNMALKIT